MTTERDEIVARVKEEIFKEIREGSAGGENPVDLAAAISRLAARAKPAWTLSCAWQTHKE